MPSLLSATCTRCLLYPRPTSTLSPRNHPRALLTTSSNKPRLSVPRMSATATKFSHTQEEIDTNNTQTTFLHCTIGQIRRRIHGKYVKTRCVRTILLAKPVGEFTLYFMMLVDMHRRAHAKRFRRWWCRWSAGEQINTVKCPMYRRLPHVQATLLCCTAPTI